jgi:hypothetical protein
MTESAVTYAEKPLRISLLWTCLVTNVRRDGSISSADRVEFLRRTLDSLANLTLHSAHVFVEFGSDVVSSRDQYLPILQGLSVNTKVSTLRLETSPAWNEAMDDVLAEKPDLVLLLTYEDHIFHKRSDSELARLAQTLVSHYQEGSDRNIFAVLSHFPELHIQADFWHALGRAKNLDSDLIFPVATPIGCLLGNPLALAAWFRDDFARGNKVVSTENYFGPSVEDRNGFTLVARREIFEHIDGYGHVGLSDLPSDLSGPMRDAGLRLLGKSLTMQALKRCGFQLSTLKYVRLVIGLRGITRGVRLVLRSLWIWALGATLGRLLASHPVFWSWIYARPRLTHILAVASTHGLFRFTLLELRALRSKFWRSRMF